MPPQDQLTQNTNQIDPSYGLDTQGHLQPPAQKPNKSKLIVLAILVVAIIIGGLSFFVFSADDTSESVNTSKPETTNSDEKAVVKIIDAKQLNTEFLRSYTGDLELTLVEGDLNSSVPQAIFADSDLKYFIDQDLETVSQLTYPINDTSDTDLLSLYDDFLISQGLMLKSGSLSGGVYQSGSTIARYSHNSTDCFITYWRVEAQDRNLTIGCAEEPPQNVFTNLEPFYNAYSTYYNLELGFEADDFGNQYAIMIEVGEAEPGDSEGYEVATGSSVPILNQNGVFSTDMGGGRASFFRKTNGDWQYFEGASGQSISNCDSGDGVTQYTEDAYLAYADFPCYNATLGDDNYTFGRYLADSKE